MSVDIMIGRLVHDEDGTPRVEWPDERADDGTSPYLSSSSGLPRRSLDYDWPKSSAAAEMLTGVAMPLPGADDMYQFVQIDGTLLRLIERLPVKTAIDKDRRQWFRFWAERARPMFGDDAYISFWY